MLLHDIIYTYQIRLSYDTVHMRLLMFKLFTKRYTSNNSVIHPASFELVKRIYQRELLHLKNYYHDRQTAVKSNHLLCRILNSASVPMEYDLGHYTEVATTRSPYIAKFFNLTSEISYGKIFDGVFYGEGNNEVLLYNEEYFSPFDVVEDWKNIAAVKVLTHPVSNLGLMLPDGFKNNDESGLCVISINIPLLLVQYRCFVMQQAGKLFDDSTGLLSLQHFVHMYVLPNMLDSHLDVAIVNRLMNLYYDEPMGVALKRHPFPIVDYSGKLDYVLDVALKYIDEKQTLYYSTLKNIPGVTKEDGQDTLLVPGFARTRQVWWALFVSRLSIMKFLIDVGGASGIHNNGEYINALKTDIKRIRQENVMKSALPYELYEEVEGIFDDILAI